MVFFFKQKTAYEMRISDWSSDVCSSDRENAFSEPKIVVADARLNITFQLVRCLRGRQVEGAARGIASAQCALRATQHFGAGHVETTEIADHRTPDIHSVTVDADGCIGDGVRSVLPLAPNRNVDAPCED